MGRPRNFDTDTVVDRAMDAFWTYGYANTSPAQLAEATGIGKGSLYHSFGSKRELFERALARYDLLGAEFATEMLARPGTTRECIAGLLRVLADSDVAQPVQRGCLVVNTATELAAHDPEIARAVQSAQDRMIGALVARIEQGLRDRDVRAGLDARACGEFLMNTIAGLRVMAKTYDSETLHRIINSALTTL